MAILSFGPLVLGLRGSVGGVTFSVTGTGPTVRMKPLPPKPKSAKQVLMQSYIAWGASTWRDLAQAVKDQWVLYGDTITLTDSLNREYSPTGRQVYCWSAFTQLNWVTAPDMTLPTDVGLAIIPVLTFDFSGHDLRLTGWNPAPAAADTFSFLVYYADRPRAFNRMPLKTNLEVPGDSGLPLVLSSDVDAGWLVDSELRIYVNVREIDADHRVSTKLIQSLDFTVV